MLRRLIDVFPLVKEKGSIHLYHIDSPILEIQELIISENEYKYDVHYPDVPGELKVVRFHNAGKYTYTSTRELIKDLRRRGIDVYHNVWMLILPIREEMRR